MSIMFTYIYVTSPVAGFSFILHGYLINDLFFYHLGHKHTTDIYYLITLLGECRLLTPPANPMQDEHEVKSHLCPPDECKSTIYFLYFSFLIRKSRLPQYLAVSIGCLMLGRYSG